nr:M23 family metallopeptidase [Mycobacterium sp. E3298]
MKIVFSPLGTVTTSYGAIDTSHPLRPHSGIDFAAPLGTPIHSPVNGVVSDIVDRGTQGLGKGVFIRTDEGYQFIFGHLSEFNVKVGDHIHRGDIIALSGNTGHSTGPHLHFAVKDPSGHFIDPHSISQQAKSLMFDLKDTVQTVFNQIGDTICNLFEVVADNAVLV